MPEHAPSTLQYLTAIGSIATPVLVLLLTAVGWGFRHRLERRLELERKLREDRINTYNEILEPFVLLLMSEDAWTSDPANEGKNKNDLALKKMLSLEYRRQAFKMSLVGSDNVVRSYNDLMQYTYRLADEHGATNPRSDPNELIAFLGAFLLQIRRSMGNEATVLDKWAMLEWFIKDARNLRR